MENDENVDLYADSDEEKEKIDPREKKILKLANSKEEKEKKKLIREIERKKEKEEKKKKDEEAKLKKELLRVEYIRKIKSALSDDLLGKSPEHEKYKSMKLDGMKFELIEGLWREIKASISMSHPRETIWNVALKLTNKVEEHFKDDPVYSCNGFTDSLRKDEELRLSAHILMLDWIPHNSNGEILTIANSLYKHYSLCNNIKNISKEEKDKIKKKSISKKETELYNHL